MYQSRLTGSELQGHEAACMCQAYLTTGKLFTGSYIIQCNLVVLSTTT